jgi:hypothetical protein
MGLPFEVGHKDIPLSDYEAFRAAPPPELIERVIDRRETGLLGSFVPNARGVALASSLLLRIAKIRGSHSNSLKCAGPDFVRRDWDGTCLDTERFGDLWTVEWLTWVSPQVLVHRIGSTPIVTRTSEEALQLAELCASDPPRGLCWIAKMPPDIGLLENVQKMTCAAALAHREAKAA